MAKRPGRVRNQLPHCYYEGYMEKRSVKDKTSRKLWTCLCGKMLFFFNNSKDTEYVERLDLNNFISITDDCSRDRKLDAARLILRLKDEDIPLTAPSLEARELWKGFIYSVVQLSVPSSLNLLPGQIHMLKETIEREKERMQAISPQPVAPSPSFDTNIYVIPVGDMPACYHHVSRMEAELMLERHHDKGNLLLRPGRDGTSFAITTRQEMNGSVFRHYRVARKHDGSFAIDVDQPIICATLHDVISSMVKKTGGTMTPFIMDGTYDENIMFVQSDEENGEKSVQSALSDSIPPQVPCPPRPGPRIPLPEPEFETGEKLYLNDTWTEKEKELVVRPPVPFRLPVLNICPLPDSSNSCDSIPSSGLERKAPKQALMPPTISPRSFSLPSSSVDNLGPAAAPRTFTLPSSSTDNLGPAAAPRTFTLPSSSVDNLGPAAAPRTFTLPSSSADNQDGRTRRLSVGSVPHDTLAQTITEELRQKLEKRRIMS